MIRSIFWCTGLLLASLAQPTSAVQCHTVFSNAVGTTAGELKLSDAVELANTGGGTLSTADLVASGNHCDGAACVEGGSHAPSLTLPSNSTKTDLRDRSLSLAPGDYYYDKVDLKDDNSVTLTGSGQVRIHVRRDLKIGDDARINVNGDPLDLVFLVGGKADIKDDARVNAIIYAADQLKVEGDARVDGAVVGAGSEIKDSARVDFASTDGLAVDGVCTAGSSGPIEGGQLNFKVEVGSLTVINTYAKPEFTRVNFTQTFDEPPLVFTLPTTQGGNSAAHRIRNVTAEGFDIMTLEPVGEDGAHISMSLNFLAVERGVHDLAGGRKLIADTIDTRRVQAYGNAGGGIGWENVAFGGVFSRAPAVLGQIQTMVNEQEKRLPTKPSRPWLTTAIRDVSAGGMQIALERSESLTGSVNRDETVAYLAVEPVDRMGFLDAGNNRIEMEVIRTAELLQGWGTCNANRVMFSAPWGKVPVVLATKNTRDGDAGVGEGDGGWLRRCNTSTTYTALQVDEIRKGNIGDRNRRHDVRERAGLVMFSGNFVTEARDLHHFRMLHDGFGIVGSPETVTIQACRNADCSQLYTGSVTVSLEPANGSTYWSGSGVLANQVTFTGGSRVVNLNRAAPGTFNIGLSATPNPANPTRCFADGSEDCSITFIEPTFTITLPDQVSGDRSSGSLALSTCWSEFQSKTMALDVAAQYLSPSWVGPTVAVNGTALPTDGSAAAVDFVFDANCAASVQVDYADAGEIGLEFDYVGSGPLAGLAISGNDSLVYYPAALIAEAANPIGTALDAAAAGASPVHTAGAGFTLKIRAVNTAGDVTRGYQPQAADRLLAYAERTGPVPGFDGSLEISPGSGITTQGGPPGGPADYVVSGIVPGDFANGVFNNAAARYAEVGLVTLYLRDADYMGHAIAAAPLAIGRFVPAGFLASGSVIHRVDTAGCGGSAFTYMDEMLRLRAQLTAVNAASGVTRNYQGGFATLGSAGVTPYAGLSGNTLGMLSAGADLSGRLAIDGAGLGVPWAAGVATLDIDFQLQAAAAPDGPHDGAILGLALSDADGIGLQGLDTDVDGDSLADHRHVAAANLRRGRLSLGNAHGSELRALQVPAVMQYYAGPGQGFRVHTQDDCTAIAGTLLADADAGDGLVVADSCIVDEVGASGTDACPPGTAGTQYRATPLAGVYAISLKSPGVGKTGALRVTADAPAWAEFDWAGTGPGNPVGLATFGIYRRDTAIIYQRELR